MKKYGNKKGFTLVEVIVVLVILAILAALIVPAMTGWISKSKAKICANNRAQLQRFYLYERTLHYDDGVEVTLEKLLAGEYEECAADVPGLKCPEGGTYSVDATTGTLVCSIAAHNTVAAPVDSNPITNGFMDVIYNEGFDKIGALDSGATQSTAIQKILSELADSGADVSGMKSWSYKKSPERLMWTTVDITTLKPGDQVPVLRYNVAAGTYTVWMSVVRESTTVVTGGAKQTYNYLTEGREVAASMALPAEQKKDYDQAKAWFDDALKQAGY